MKTVATGEAKRATVGGGMAREVIRHACRFLPSLTLLSLGALGCGSRAGSPPPLRIAAASDLQAALPELAERFQSNTKTPVTVTFGASGQLAEQIKGGAPFDVFMAANETFVTDLATLRLIRPDSVSRYARGSLVLAVHDAVGANIKSLDDLKRGEIAKIALANPATAPYGKAGKQALERRGLWEALSKKIVVAESVRQALLYAEKGDADAALVGRAIARVPGVRAIDIDPALYDPIIQALGVVASSARGSDAEKFVRFVLEGEGHRILRERGFQPGRE
jgi:molybdate transport system substrate-binding protein